ncbi:MAG: MFS transporter [Gemmatales bacterium]
MRRRSAPGRWRSSVRARSLGAAVGLVTGGLLAGAIGWRWTMVAAGAPGLVVGALVLLTLADRHEHRRQAARPALGMVLARLVRNRSFVLAVFGCALLSFVNYGAMAFAGSFYLRVHADGIGAIAAALGLAPIGVVGLGLGILGGAGGALGAIVGGRLGDRRAPGDPRPLVLIPAIGSLFCALSYVAMFSVPGAILSLLIFFVASFFSAPPGTAPARWRCSFSPGRSARRPRSPCRCSSTA